MSSGKIRSTVAARYEELFKLLERAGLPKQSLQLAWDFTTGDDAQLAGPLLQMRDAALAKLAPTDPPTPPEPLLAIDKVENAPRDPLLRQVIGTFGIVILFDR